MPGLLVTGRAGSGKTSILNAAAKALQEHDKTFACMSHLICVNRPPIYTSALDTLYIDLSRYTEAPVSKIKSLFKYWFEKAQWHRPSVIVMDNMDALMSAEQEVGFNRVLGCYFISHCCAAY